MSGVLMYGAPPDHEGWEVDPLTPEQIKKLQDDIARQIAGASKNASGVVPDVNIIPVYGAPSTPPVSARFPVPAPSQLPANALVQGAITRLVGLRLSDIDPAAMRAEIDGVIGTLTIAVSLLDAK